MDPFDQLRPHKRSKRTRHAREFRSPYPMSKTKNKPEFSHLSALEIIPEAGAHGKHSRPESMAGRSRPNPQSLFRIQCEQGKNIKSFEIEIAVNRMERLTRKRAQNQDRAEGHEFLYNSGMCLVDENSDGKDSILMSLKDIGLSIVQETQLEELSSLVRSRRIAKVG
eukprot:1095643-Amorphochlora_amoeboformis.AAC.1